MLLPHYKGHAIRLSQKGNAFYYFPMPSRKAVEVLGYNKLRWNDENSALAGFNREIDQKHVNEIVRALNQENVLIPNPLIVYFLSKNLTFTPSEHSKPPVEFGDIKLLTPESHEDSHIGFVIDGQHRLEALKKIEIEKGEEDINVGIIAYHAPENEKARKEFDKFVLEQMDTINRSKPLSQNERYMVQQRIDLVSTRFNPKDAKRATCNLIIKELDIKTESPVNFKDTKAKKKPGKGFEWLDLSVWVNVLHDIIDYQAPLNAIFNNNYSESTDNRNKAVKILDIYLRAVKGLVNDKNYWEVSSKKQRLYHNVGLYVILNSLDAINNKADVFSQVYPGRLKTQNDIQAIKAIQKVLKPIRLIDWEVGKGNDLKMAGIQKQKNIPQNLFAAFKKFMNHCLEYQEQKSPKEERYEFIVRDSAGIEVCNEKIKISKRDLDRLDRAIEDGKFLIE